MQELLGRNVAIHPVRREPFRKAGFQVSVLYVATDHFIIDAVNWLPAAQARLLQDHFGWTALHWTLMGTVQGSRLETRDRRLHGERGPSPSVRYSTGNAVLHYMAKAWAPNLRRHFSSAFRNSKPPPLALDREGLAIVDARNAAA